MGAVERAKQLLKDAGYIVIPKERRVIIHSRYLVSPWDLERFSGAPERYTDMVLSTHLRSIAGEIKDQGLYVHSKNAIDDPVTGKEVYFDTAVAVIKPKDE